MLNRFLPAAKAYAAFAAVLLTAFVGAAFGIPPTWATTAIAVLTALSVYAVPNSDGDE